MHPVPPLKRCAGSCVGEAPLTVCREHECSNIQFQVQSALMHMQMAADKGQLQKESSMLRSKLVAEKQHAAVLQVTLLALYSLLTVLYSISLRTAYCQAAVAPGRACFFPDSVSSLSSVIAWHSLLSFPIFNWSSRMLDL